MSKPLQERDMSGSGAAAVLALLIVFTLLLITWQPWTEIAPTSLETIFRQR